ncbi:MAG: UvrD-helicase domain-containing protein [Burkholderiales bacterium]|nr:UvrD-helicase domain-containing protein [Burkholderiales bacterium]
MNKVIIASAGSGKTHRIVIDAIALASSGRFVLITTFTNACELEIKNKIIQILGYIPQKILVQTWFSFLIEHGVKPFQGKLFNFDIKGMELVPGKSGLRFIDKDKNPIFWGENNFLEFFFNKRTEIYSDKLSLLVLRCNEKSAGLVFERISKCFQHIFVDEVQDLAGYDLDVLELIFKSTSTVTLVGDPRQATYSTHMSKKYEKYAKSLIFDFFNDHRINFCIDIDSTSLTKNYRCNDLICNFSNSIYPNLPHAESGNITTTEHDGVFVIDSLDVEKYLLKFNPVQLHENKKSKFNPQFQRMNFGKSKGLTFDRVLILPSTPMKDWLVREKEMGSAAMAKFYIAVTRAKFSVAIILERKLHSKVKNVPVYSFSDA